MMNSDQWLHGTKMFRIISKDRLRKLSVHQRNKIYIISELSRCSGCNDRCGWSILYSKWLVGGKIINYQLHKKTDTVQNRMLLIVYKIVRSTGLTCVIENAIICVIKNALGRGLMMIYQVEMGKPD